jgi:hypothetical protein
MESFQDQDNMIKKVHELSPATARAVEHIKIP